MSKDANEQSCHEGTRTRSITRSQKIDSVCSLPSRPFGKDRVSVRVYRATLVVLWLLLAVAATSAQTKTVEAMKDGSLIIYRINHTLHHIEATSKDGWFRVELDPARREIKSVTAQVDVMTFDSGNSNRDSHAMEVVESIKYPDVTFASTGVTQNGDSLSVTGKLTFHGVTKDIVMAGITKWSQNKLEVQGSFELSITAFKIERPSLLMIPVDDALKFSLSAAFAW
jgi:polyisoprenoid-binding protein YceI